MFLKGMSLSLQEMKRLILPEICSCLFRKESYTKAMGMRSGGLSARLQHKKLGMTASNIVLEIIKETDDEGVNFAEIQDKTGFAEKKIRNIIFRLNKRGSIKRKNRGIYVAT